MNFAAGLHSIVLYGTEPATDAPSPSSAVANTDLTLFIGLIVAFIIFLVVVICMIKILRNKSVPHPSYTLTGPGVSGPGTGGMYYFSTYFQKKISFSALKERVLKKYYKTTLNYKIGYCYF